MLSTRSQRPCWPLSSAKTIVSGNAVRGPTGHGIFGKRSGHSGRTTKFGVSSYWDVSFAFVSDSRRRQNVPCLHSHRCSRTQEFVKRTRSWSAFRSTPQWDPSFPNTLRHITCPGIYSRDLKLRWITPVSKTLIDLLMTELTELQTQAMSNSSVSKRPLVITHRFQLLQLHRIPPTLRVGFPLPLHIPLVHRESQPGSASYTPIPTFLYADQNTSLPCSPPRFPRQCQVGNAKFTPSLWRKLISLPFTGCSNGSTRTGFCSRKKMTRGRP